MAAEVGLGSPDDMSTLVAAAHLRKSREITLHVRHEHRHPDPRKALGQHLQAHRLSGACRAGDQAVTIGKFGQQANVGGGVGSLGYEIRQSHRTILFQ